MMEDADVSARSDEGELPSDSPPRFVHFTSPGGPWLTALRLDWIVGVEGSALGDDDSSYVLMAGGHRVCIKESAKQVLLAIRHAREKNQACTGKE
jgi:hypothetical protein